MSETKTMRVIDIASVSIVGKFQTDYTTYLAVDSGGLIYTKRLTKPVSSNDRRCIGVHIAQCILESLDELPEMASISHETETGVFRLYSLNKNHFEVNTDPFGVNSAVIPPRSPR